MLMFREEVKLYLRVHEVTLLNLVAESVTAEVRGQLLLRLHCVCVCALQCRENTLCVTRSDLCWCGFICFSMID